MQRALVNASTWTDRADGMHVRSKSGLKSQTLCLHRRHSGPQTHLASWDTPGWRCIGMTKKCTSVSAL